MPKKVDANQTEIVKALRQAGCTVTSTAMVGKGFPDIVVGYDDMSFLMEIKMPGGKLTPDEMVWHNDWDGQVAIVYSIEDALRVVGLMD